MSDAGSKPTARSLFSAFSESATNHSKLGRRISESGVIRQISWDADLQL
jgi:hypothetical protein